MTNNNNDVFAPLQMAAQQMRQWAAWWGMIPQILQGVKSMSDKFDQEKNLISKLGDLVSELTTETTALKARVDAHNQADADRATLLQGSIDDLKTQLAAAIAAGGTPQEFLDGLSRQVDNLTQLRNQITSIDTGPFAGGGGTPQPGGGGGSDAGGTGTGT